jgi:hypothetical protein
MLDAEVGGREASAYQNLLRTMIYLDPVSHATVR